MDILLNPFNSHTLVQRLSKLNPPEISKTSARIDDACINIYI